MARVVLIHNPAASRTDEGVVRTVCEVFENAGWSVDAPGTSHPDHAAEIAEQCVASGVDVIAIYGGDGTVHAVAGTVGNEVPLGLIRGGTGNLLAGNLRLPRNPTRAARVIVDGVPRAIDLGRLVGSEGVRYFTVACGTGFDAELMAATSGSAKRRWGMGAYVATAWQVLSRHETVSYKVTVDDASFEVDAASVMVANCGEIIPPFLRLRPGITPDDGLLDVVVLNANGVIESAAVLWQLATGQSGRNGRVKHIRGSRVTVESDLPKPVELDGEPAGMTPFTAEVIKGGISVILPRNGKLKHLSGLRSDRLQQSGGSAPGVGGGDSG
jgi:YegS/Rv2252/BmrU family lipid kinase